VDPKGSEYTHYEHKIEGYKVIFEDNGVQKLFDFEGLCVKVWLFLFTSDVNAIPPGYRHYWSDNLDTIAKGMLEL
jgi:hypothetical protein